MKKILYICSNDGSDMRILKEVKSLSDQFEIYFLGEGIVSDISFASGYCKQFDLTNYKRNTFKSVVKRYALFFKLVRDNNFHSFHIINEQTLLFFLPFFLIKKNYVLDIFDSIFLRLNKSAEKYSCLKRIFYQPAKKIVVTDDNRKSLMPSFCNDKILVIENFPQYFPVTVSADKKPDREITIFYGGTLGYKRGTEFLLNLITADPDFRIIMAGWVADEETKGFTKHPNVEYRGVMTQYEANKVAANEADYILCIYNPVNENNINASPNKIYDAIQTGVPVIINSEVKISSFVRESAIGFVLTSFHVKNYIELSIQLKKWIKTFRPNPIMKENFCWEKIEHKLLSAHQ